MATSDGEGDNGRRGEEEEVPTSHGVVQLPAYSCLLKGVGDAMAGAVMGSVYGFGSGLFQRQGFKGALSSSVSSAKTFALLSGMHGFVTTLLVQIRGKKDALNAGIAGCATGLALSTPGNPAALLQGCATFGVFSYFIERLNTQTAVAAPLHKEQKKKKKRNMHQVFEGYSVLPPFTLAPAGLFIFHEPKMHLLNSR